MIRPGGQGRRWRDPRVVAGDAWQRLAIGRVPIASWSGYALPSYGRDMRCLPLAAIAFILTGCGINPSLIFDPNRIIDTRMTGGENAMRSLSSNSDASFRDGDKASACDANSYLAEVNVDLYKDISKETMSLLRSYQKRCGRYVFK